MSAGPSAPEVPMPRTHMRAFRVRYYECDAYGHVNHAQYLRYMQEAAFDASAAAGYDLARYQTMERTWLIRETEIEYLRPLHYGDTVHVKTWVDDFRRIRSRRAYEFHCGGPGRLAARASTDWVFLNTVTGHPAAIPQELVSAFYPEGAPNPAPRPGIQRPPPPPPEVFRVRRTVEWRDLDPMGHVNNAVYLAYLEDCGIQVADAHGWSLQRTEAEGLAIVARRHHIEYRQPAALGDELELATWITEVRPATILRHFAISRIADGALLAQANTRWVWVDLATQRPVRAPASFLDDFAANMSPAITQRRA
jgi:acyl-CoA thioester hydrolase